MKTTLRLLMVSALALLITVPAAFAQIPQVSTLPVDEPLDVGGTILSPGVYTIRVLPTPGDRNRVQITSTDLKTIYATLLTVPHDLKPGEEMPNSMFIFYPAAEGSTRALRTWFPPDTQWKAGKDIVYEESRAKQLARIASEPVPAYRGEIAETTEVEVITPDATVEAYVPPPAAPVTAVVEPTVTPEPMISSQPEPAPEMPETAGRIPLIALIGLLSLGAAGAFRLFRQA